MELVRTTDIPLPLSNIADTKPASATSSSVPSSVLKSRYPDQLSSLHTEYTRIPHALSDALAQVALVSSALL